MGLLKDVLKIILWIAVFLGILVAVGRFTIWEPGEAPDNAMAPNIWKGDKFIILTRGTVERGSVVYCHHPVYNGQVVIGRVVGLPGDTLEIIDGQLKINGDDVFSEWDKNPMTVLDRESSINVITARFRKGSQNINGRDFNIMMAEGGTPPQLAQTEVKSGYFLLGDNRSLAFGASDSRNYGEVHPSLCMGRVFIIWKASKGWGDADLSLRIFKPIL